MQNILNQLSIDCVLFGYKDDSLKVLLVKRRLQPEKGKWALPGGFINKDEDVDASSRRILSELTGVKNLYMEQVGAFGKVNRYPGQRVVTVAYYALVNPESYEVKAGPDAEEADWISLDQLPVLPFDHLEILQTAREQLKRKARFEPVGFELLPAKFTLYHLQKLYQAIFDMEFDKPNFRRKIKKLEVLKPLNEKWTDGVYRSAQLFKFDEKKYRHLQKKGVNFEIY